MVTTFVLSVQNKQPARASVRFYCRLYTEKVVVAAGSEPWLPEHEIPIIEEQWAEIRGGLIGLTEEFFRSEVFKLLAKVRRAMGTVK